MQYNYTREHQLPIVMELTYEDLHVIHKMTKFLLELEEKPTDIYNGDIRKLHRESLEALAKVADAATHIFTAPAE